MLKQRSLDKPLSLLVNSIDMVEEIAENISEMEYALMNAFFPGPFTIILEKKDIIPDCVTSGTKTVGVRMPQNDIAKKLIEFSKTPIAAPSANISNKPSGTNYESIINDFHGKIDYFIDSGESKLGIASTIVKMKNEKLNILREGSISKEEIENVLYKGSHYGKK